MRRTRLPRYRKPLLLGDAIDGSPTGWAPYSSTALLGVVVALLLSGVALAVSVSGYVSDGRARDDVFAVQREFDAAQTQYLLLRNLDEEATRQKALLEELEPIVQEVKENVTQTAADVDASQTNETVALYDTINALLAQLSADYSAQLDALQIELSVLLSRSNVTSTLQRSGTCLMQGLNDTVIDYEYRISDFASLVLPFYVFKGPSASIDMGNTTGFQFGPCAPPILEGAGTVSAPLLARTLAESLSAPADFFSHVTSGGAQVVFARATSYAGVEQSVQLLKDMSLWVSLM